MEKPTPPKGLTDQKLDLLAIGGGSAVPNNKESNIPEKNLPKRRSPPRSNRPQPNPVENSDPFAPLSPMDLIDITDSSLGKQPTTRYPSLLDTNTRLTTNISRANSIGLDNTQSQSPLSPVKNICMKTESLYTLLVSRVLYQHSILHHHHQLYRNHHFHLDRYLHQQNHSLILVTIHLIFYHLQMNYSHIIEKTFQHHLFFHDQVLHLV
jgi:hypothetical protein